MLPKIKQNRTLADQAYTLIKKSIVNNELKPGDWLAEEEIASQMGISRTPIRSALTQLSYEGLVEMSPGKRARVSTISDKDIRDFLVIREVLEALAAELATTEMTETDFEDLEDIVARQKKSIESEDFTQFVELDRQFHSRIASVTNNKKLSEFVENLNTQLQRFLILTGTLQKAAREAVEEHENIVEALRTKKADKAKEAMAYHVRQVSERMTT